MEINTPCDKCKRPTPTKAQWDYDGPLHGNGNGCECDECVSMCWGDPVDCARAARGEPAVSRYTQERVDALIAIAIADEREACAGTADYAASVSNQPAKNNYEWIAKKIRDRGAK